MNVSRWAVINRYLINSPMLPGMKKNSRTAR